MRPRCQRTPGAPHQRLDAQLRRDAGRVGAQRPIAAFQQRHDQLGTLILVRLPRGRPTIVRLACARGKKSSLGRLPKHLDAQDKVGTVLGKRVDLVRNDGDHHLDVGLADSQQKVLRTRWNAVPTLSPHKRRWRAR